LFPARPTLVASTSTTVHLPEIATKFEGFDRNPYLVAFRAGKLTFLLADVRLYFGDEDETTGMDPALPRRPTNRPLGPNLRRRSKNAYTTAILALGDFNLPVRDESDPVFRALTRRGLHLPEHSTKVGGSNISDDAQYDQKAVFPGAMKDAISATGVFDFDGAVFRDLSGNGTKAEEQVPLLRQVLPL
jgi:hypothetical protein